MPTSAARDRDGLGTSHVRKEIYDAYKANRPPAPADLKQQMARCEQVVRAFNIPIFKQDGVEADDLIASAVRKRREARFESGHRGRR